MRIGALLQGSVGATTAKRRIEKQKTCDRALNNKSENDALGHAESTDFDMNNVVLPEVQTRGVDAPADKKSARKPKASVQEAII